MATPNATTARHPRSADEGGRRWREEDEGGRGRILLPTNAAQLTAAPRATVPSAALSHARSLASPPPMPSSTSPAAGSSALASLPPPARELHLYLTSRLAAGSSARRHLLRPRSALASAPLCPCRELLLRRRRSYSATARELRLGAGTLSRPPSLCHCTRQRERERGGEDVKRRGRRRGVGLTSGSVNGQI